MKKNILVSVILFFPVLFLSVFLYAQEAEDIIVPPVYSVVKIAQTNRVPDPWGLEFDTSGNLYVGSISSMFFKVDIDQNVETLANTRKFDFAPREIKIAPDGSIIVNCLYNLATDRVSKWIGGDQFISLIELNGIRAIEFDEQGNLFVAAGGYIYRYDSSYLNIVDTIPIPSGSIQDMVFDINNNLYISATRYPFASNGVVWKVESGIDGISDSSDSIKELITGLNRAYYLSLSQDGHLFVSQRSYTKTDGFSWYPIDKVSQFDPQTGAFIEDTADGLSGVRGLACRGDDLYVSEFNRGVIAKISLSSYIKSDYTFDFGITYPGAIAFDSLDRLYTHSFRDFKLFRLNNSGFFDQVGEGTGYAQSIATKGDYFYLGSQDNVGGNGYQILEINPINETMEVIGSNLGGWRSVAFDSLDRLILNTHIDINQGEYGIDIIDLETGEARNYVIGVHNKGRCIQFDSNQNLYVVEGIGDGIKKVPLAENYDPPRDISMEPLFYDFTANPVPPAIYFFHVNRLEEVFIPQMDTGTLLIGDRYGEVRLFASGFLSPSQVTFDEYGAMYVSDNGNGIFKITYEGWKVIPVLEKLDALIQEIKNSDVQIGIKISLQSKIENAIRSLENKRIIACLNQVKAFKNEVEAQKGKELPDSLADRWIGMSEEIIGELEDLLGI